MSFLLPILTSVAALWRVATLPPPRFSWMVVYLTVNLLRLIVQWMTYGNPTLYGRIWIYSQPVVSMLWIAVAVELYGLVADLYPGLNRPGWAAAALVIAIGLTMTTVIEPHSHVLEIMFVLTRVSATVLIVAIGLLALLFRFFRNSLRPNLLRHAAIMPLYLLTQAAATFGANYTKDIVNWSKVNEYGGPLAYLAWALLMTAEGQKRREVPRKFTDAELAEASDEKLRNIADIRTDED